MKKPLLSIIIISFNTKEITSQTISSIFMSIEKSTLKKSDLEVIVIDNDSKDDSVSHLKKLFGDKVEIITNNHNVGFARANNQGVAKSHGEFVLLLNSDTIVSSGALEDLLSCIKGNSRVGAAAAYLINPDGSYQQQGGALPTLINVAAWWLWPLPGVIPGIKPYQDPNPVTGSGFIERGWVGGTALLLKKSVYEAIGGLDEHVFMYGEDVDLSHRLRRAGLHVGICKRAVVTHLGSASSSSSKARLGEVKGALYIFKKHKPEWQTLLLRIILMIGAILRLILFGILKGNGEARRLYTQVLLVAFK